MRERFVCFPTANRICGVVVCGPNERMTWNVLVPVTAENASTLERRQIAGVQTHLGHSFGNFPDRGVLPCHGQQQRVLRSIG
ncbi:hypothetical protein BJK06_04780 [Curtobacterium sp. BH-2-1-1]|nr:hypothetical protein BJK06_04780 [Curtobacterium sp. BH-2-1-1]